MNPEEDLNLLLVDYETSQSSQKIEIKFSEKTQSQVSKKDKSQKNKKFNCHLCDASLFSEKFLSRHIATRHPKTPKIMVCDFDGKTFRNKENLKFHMERHRHRSSEYLTCEICQKSYVSKMTFKRHLRTHIEKFPCDQCDMSFHNKINLESHRSSTHLNEEISIPCNFCTRTFTSIANRNNHHHMAHKNNKLNLFRCNECKIDFEMKEELRIHSFIHFNGNIHTCLDCHQIFKTQRLLTIHMQKHGGKKFHCEDCGDSFTFKTGLQKHVRMKRCKGPGNKIANEMNEDEIARIVKKQLEMVSTKKNTEEIEIVEECKMIEDDNGFEDEFIVTEMPQFDDNAILDNKPADESQESITKLRKSRAHLEYSCDFCGELVKFKKSMEKHMKDCHEFVPPSCKYKCEKCPDVQFKSRKKLKEHYLDLHGIKVESVEAKFICYSCGKTFDTQSYYKSHLLTHSEDYRSHFCKFCSAAFKSVGNLRRHEATHAESRDFVCSECSKSFKTKLALKIHNENVHVDMKVFVKCTVCGSILLEKNLRNHMKNQHTEEGQEKPFHCIVCFKTFKNEAVAQRHYKSVHEPNFNGVVYTCDECPDEKFFRKRDLREHSFIHFKGDVYRCKCGKMFKTKRMLIVHQQSHKGETFPCVICTSLEFKSKGGLRKHNAKYHDDN